MKRLLLVLFLLFTATNLLAQEPAKKAQAEGQKVEAAKEVSAEVKAQRISRKQKRELGILPRQVIPLAKQMAKDGDITKDMTSRELAFCYAAEVASSQEYGGAWRQVEAGTYGVDWDGLILFLERLFELLMKFIPIFL